MKIKILILGGGFISSNLINLLKKKKINFFLINRKVKDLQKKDSINFIKKNVDTQTVILFVAAVVPVKSLKMFQDNIEILNNIVLALKNKKFKKLIYISSDAVFSDRFNKIKEDSEKNPDSLHGLMHFYRENILKFYFKNLSIIRPTLIYGVGDPHNGYGPNLFLRDVQQDKNISLFGKGEEIRDHINIEDVVKIIYLNISKNFNTDLNVVTSKNYSFFQIAKRIVKIYKSSKIIFKKRNGKMPHNGFRVFDNKKLKKNFPHFKFNNLFKWIDKKEIY